MKYLLLVMMVFLGGCFAEEEVKTVEYYMQNESERVEKIKWCQDSSDRAGANCTNAIDAQAKINMEKSFSRELIFKKPSEG